MDAACSAFEANADTTFKNTLFWALPQLVALVELVALVALVELLA